MEYKELYEKLVEEFQSYHDFAEKKLYELNDANKQLEKNLSIYTNIVEMARYINLYMFDDMLLEKINDSIVGMLGVSHSTIHIFNGFSLEPKASTLNNLESARIHYELELLKERNSFIVNKLESIYKKDNREENMHSVIAVPIGSKNNFIGYIVVEHKYYAFFYKDDIKFLEYIADQVAMGITNRNLYKKVQKAAKRDALLDIYNRKYFYERISNIMGKKAVESFSIVMSDIDNFKKVNDTYGHQVGDYALKHIVNIINFNLGKDDIIARYGGEEIIFLIMNYGNKEKVINKVERIRKDIEKFPLGLVDGKNIYITMSFGLAYLERVEETMEIDDIIKVADDNLYRAKANGKNRVEF